MHKQYGLTTYKSIPVLIVPWLYFGTGFALPFLIVTLTRNKRTIDDLEYVAHLEHEYTHVKQWWRTWLVGFLPIYFYDLFKHGYRSEKHRFEHEARTAEKAIIKKGS